MNTRATFAAALFAALFTASCGTTRSLDPQEFDRVATLWLTDSTVASGEVVAADSAGVELADELDWQYYPRERISRVVIDTLSRQDMMLREAVRNSSKAASNTGAMWVLWGISFVAGFVVAINARF